MIFRHKNKSIIYRYVTVSGLPFPVVVVRDPNKGGFTTYMPDFSPCISQGESINEAIESLKISYKCAKNYEKKRLNKK